MLKFTNFIYVYALESYVISFNRSRISLRFKSYISEFRTIFLFNSLRGHTYLQFYNGHIEV